MKKTMFNFDSKQEIREAFKAGNRARKKESVVDTVESVDKLQQQIDLFKEQTGKELEIRDGRPYFDGRLWLSDCTGLISLPDGLEVGGSLDLRGCNRLTSLPTGLKIGGNLWIKSCTELTSLPDGLKVGGSLNVRDCDKLTSLPTSLKVRGDLWIKDCTGLTRLPADLKVGGDLWLNGCTGLTSLPAGLKVNGCLSLKGCTRLTSLPAGLEVGGLSAENCTGLTSLPAGLKVKGKLYLQGCTGLTELPNNLKVGGGLNLIGCTGLTGLPFDLVVQGPWIVHHGILTQFFEKLGIPVDRAGDTKAVYWCEWQKAHGYLKEAFKAGNRARKKESVQDTVDSVYNIQEQIDQFKEQTGIELEIRDGRPYFSNDLWLGGCTELTSLPVGLEAKRLSLTGCTGLTSLPDGLKVREDLSLEGCTRLTSLPNGLKVGRTLNLEGCTRLTSLPNRLKVGNNIWLKGCTGLTSLPADLKVRGFLDLEGCTGLTSLPDGLKVRGMLSLRGCTGLTSLPTDLEVENYLDLRNCTGLTSLPAGLKVGGLDLGGCTGLISLPSDLVVHGVWIAHSGILTPFFKKLGIPVDKFGNTKAEDWRKWQEANGYLKEAFRAGNRARKKEAAQDAQTDNIDTIDNLEDLLDVCDKVVRMYSGKEHLFPLGWVFGASFDGFNFPDIRESPVNDRKYLRNWLVKYRYDFNGSRIRIDLTKEIPGDDDRRKFDSEWDIIHSTSADANHLNFDYTVGVMKVTGEDGYRIIFNDGVNEACIYMPGYSRSNFGVALMYLFGATFMKRYVKAAYYQGVNDPLGDENYKEAVQMIIHLFTEPGSAMSAWKPEQVISVEIRQEPVYTNNDFTK